MVEKKKVEDLKWTGKNEDVVNDYLSKAEGISWHYYVEGGKKKLYIVKDGIQKEIKRNQEITW